MPPAKKIIQPKTIAAVIADMAPKDKQALIEINQKALLKGIALERGAA